MDRCPARKVHAVPLAASSSSNTQRSRVITPCCITCHHTPSPHTLHRGAQRAACPSAQAATAFTSECRGVCLLQQPMPRRLSCCSCAVEFISHLIIYNGITTKKSQHLQLLCLICNRLRAGIFSKATSCRPKSTRTCSLRLISFMFCFRALFVNNIMIFALGAAVEPRAHGAKAHRRHQHLFACTLNFTAGWSSS